MDLNGEVLYAASIAVVTQRLIRRGADTPGVPVVEVREPGGRLVTPCLADEARALVARKLITPAEARYSIPGFQ
jgi:hypothetical protein